MPRLTNRFGEEKLNNQGHLMKIIKYNNSKDIVIEFQDNYKAKIHTNYTRFKRGNIKNPYHPSVYEVGMIGDKYFAHFHGKGTKEYYAWTNILKRCYGNKENGINKSYKDVICCKEWFLFENFYSWLHNQENFDKWYNGDKWAIDKDILVKGNKIYSPETCCLVPINVNSLFVKNDMLRGDLPIGVSKVNEKFRASCSNPFTHKPKKSTCYATFEEAFKEYKDYKEDIIKQVAEIEYSKGNITEKCYNAMMNYKVEIND